MDIRNIKTLQEKFKESKETVSKIRYPDITNSLGFMEEHESILFKFFVLGVNKAIEGMKENKDGTGKKYLVMLNDEVNDDNDLNEKKIINYVSNH